MVKDKFPFSKNDESYICYVCHLSKQKKLPFLISCFVYVKCFDLIHIDLWGPYSIPFVYGHKYLSTIVDYHTCYT